MSKNLQIERLNCYYNFLSRGEFKTRRREKESFGLGAGAGYCRAGWEEEEEGDGDVCDGEGGWGGRGGGLRLRAQFVALPLMCCRTLAAGRGGLQPSASHL